MPAEKLVPYCLELYEHRNPDNWYDFTQLHEHDTTFGENHILDLIEDFFSQNIEANLEGESSEKTLVIEEFHRDGNIIEAIVSTGYHGYKAELRHIETGNITHIKDEDEAEQMPLYCLFSFPQTQQDESYNQGQDLFVILHQVNRIGIKSKLSSHLKRHILSGVNDTTMNVNPVYTEDVLEKVLNADRITQLDFRMRTIPGDDESRYELLQGLSTEDTSTRSLVLTPERGGSFDRVKAMAQQLSDSDRHFAEEVGDNVEDLTVTIQKGGGRSERFSLMTDEIAMRKDLNGDDLNIVDGLLTADSLRSEANDLMDDILNRDIVEPLTGTTNVER